MGRTVNERQRNHRQSGTGVTMGYLEDKAAAKAKAEPKKKAPAKKKAAAKKPAAKKKASK